MTGLDTNVLARYFIEDAADREAAKQRAAAQRLVDGGEPLYVPKSVVLEFEWVMRGYYGFSPAQCNRVLRHLLAMPQVSLEDRSGVELAVERHARGMDFADALHHAACRECSVMASFDDRRFARRARALKIAPAVQVPR